MLRTHRIRRQRWHVRARSAQEALAIRKLLRDRWEDVFRPALARAFDDEAADGDVVYVPLLELHFQLGAPEQFLSVLPEMLVDQVREQLRLAKAAAQQKPHRAAGSPGPRVEEPAAWTRVGLQEDGQQTPVQRLRSGELPWHMRLHGSREAALALRRTARRKSSRLLAVPPERAGAGLETTPLAEPAAWTRVGLQEDWRQTLVRYLHSGELPWHMRLHGSREVALALRQTARRESAHLLAVLRERAGAGLNTVAFFFRWLQLLPEGEWPEAAQAVGTSAVSEIKTTIAQIASARKTGPRHLRLSLAAALLAESVQRPDREAIRKLCSAVSRVLRRKSRHAIRELLGSLPDPTRAFLRMGILFRAAEQDRRTAAPAVSPSKAVPPRATGAVPRGQAALRAERPSSGMASQKEPGSEESEFPLATRHAGLILLHPFLPRLLECAGIKDAGETTLPGALLPRAAALLHYLATGEGEMFEFELGLHKILLGLRPESQLPVSDGLLRTREKQEANALLQAVIAHWKALRNTSVQGLRASFLQRNGLLEEDEGSWRLRVERESFDVLLDHLPWGISIVRLPWMPKPIWTEWACH